MKQKKETVRFVYDRRKKATPTNPSRIELEIYFTRNSRKIIPTDVMLLPHQWQNGKIVNHPAAHRLSVQLERMRGEYERLVLRMEANGEPVDLPSLNAHLQDSEINGNSFLDYLYDRITAQTMQESTRRRKLVVYNALKRFGRIRSFASVTAENISRFDIFLRDADPELFDESGNKVTVRTQVTLHNYHKGLKPYILEAIRLGYVKENPYNKFRDVRGQSKERKPLTEAEVSKIIGAVLRPKLSDARDLFVFSAHTGLSYSDMARFDYETDVVLKDGFPYIDGERLKTGSSYFTPILPPAIDVLKRHKYKLPIISNQKYNDYLHVIEAQLGIGKSLTSHLARHTFATIALNKGVPIEILARMLGHKNIAITQIYAKILTTSIERYAAVMR